jgi:protein-L-isoaspartate(D-aspartate) O-methyltransferase
MLLARHEDDGLLDRQAMVRDLLERGVQDERVLSAFLAVPRQHFLPGFGRSVHEDRRFPIGHEQTSSPPFLIARSLETLELRPSDRVLEIGTGSGYQAALLSLLCHTVMTVEVVPELADAASEKLRRLGRSNVQVFRGDGSRGMPEYGPYDAIVVATGAQCEPSALLAQLRRGSHLVLPEGEGDQILRRYHQEPNARADSDAFSEEECPPPLWHTFFPLEPRTTRRAGRLGSAEPNLDVQTSCAPIVRETPSCYASVPRLRVA